MRRIRRVSLPSFIAGLACASVLAGLPALADVVGADQNPTVFDSTSPALTVQPVQFVLGESISAAAQECPETKELYNWVGLRLAWSTQDATSGVASYDVSHDDTDAGPIVILDHTTNTSITLSMTNYDNNCGGGFHTSNYWVSARDHRGFTATSP